MAATHVLLFLGLGALVADIHCYSDCLFWTKWINSDTASSDGGDYETIGYNVNSAGDTGSVTKLLASQSVICNNPVEIQCRNAITKLPWYQSNDDTTFNDRYNCDTDQGLVCLDKEQADGKCKDYEVRLLCWQPCSGSCQGLAWQPFEDRDNPSGACDCEFQGWADHPQRSWAACPDGSSPLEVDCTTLASQQAALTGDVKLTCNVQQGFGCFNSHQPGSCKDYKVRYLCPQNKCVKPAIEKYSSEFAGEEFTQDAEKEYTKE